jgi:hypothetical protein
VRALLPGALSAGSKSCHCGAARLPGSNTDRCARRSASDAAVGLLSLGVWVLMPKCPVCLAAYVALWTGLGLSLATAQYVRWSLLFVSGIAMLYLAVRLVTKRSTRQLTLSARQSR